MMLNLKRFALVKIKILKKIEIKKFIEILNLKFNHGFQSYNK